MSSLKLMMSKQNPRAFELILEFIRSDQIASAAKKRFGIDQEKKTMFKVIGPVSGQFK